MFRKFLALALSISLFAAYVPHNLTASAANTAEISVSTSLCQPRSASVGKAVFARAVTGFGGKESSDVCQTLTLPNGDYLPLENKMNNGGYPRYEITHGLDFVSNPVGTFRFSFYADDDAIVGFTFHYSDVLRWMPDGSLDYAVWDSENSVMSFKTAAKLKRGRWHTIALTYNHTERAQHIYADGRFLVSTPRAGGYNWDKVYNHTTMRIGAYGGSGSGMIAIDDVYAYGGEYDSEAERVALTSDQYITADNDAQSIVYDAPKIKTVEELKNHIGYGADFSDIRICDSNFVNVSDYLPADGYCVIEPRSGRGCYAYSLCADFAVSEIKTDKTSGSVSATVINSTDKAKNAVMVLALADSGGKIQRAYLSQQKKIAQKDELIIENISFDGYTPKMFFVEDFTTLCPITASVAQKTEDTFCPGGTVFNADFNTALPFSVADKGNVIEVESESDANEVLHFERLSDTDFHADICDIHSHSDTVVYEYDIKVSNTSESDVIVRLLDSNGKLSAHSRLSKGGILTVGNHSTSLLTDVWYKVGAVYDFSKGTRSFYIDGNAVCTDFPIDIDGICGADIYMMRFQVPASPVTNNHTDFVLDNIRVYEAANPTENIENNNKIITLNRNYNSADTLASYEEYFDGITSVHTRSGVVIHSGKRHVLPTLPVGIGSDAFVAVDEICSILSLGFETADVLTIDDKTIPTDKTAAYDGKTFVNALYLFENVLNKETYTDSELLCSGLIMASDKRINLPSEYEKLQKINNYAFFVRPDEEAVHSAYKSSAAKGVHPRIHANYDDFENLKKQIQTNKYKKSLYTKLIAKADEIVASDEAVRYELTDGVRLLAVCREVLRNMYVLGMAYRLSGDKKYSDRAWTDLKAVSEFPDWHPVHSLDPAEMGTAVAIGYDWMYDAFSDSQRKIIEKGIYNNLFYPACNAVQHPNAYLTSSMKTDMNHNFVVNGGVGIGALGFMDVYPEVCRYLLSASVTNIGNAIYNYAPDGAWAEGPHYWEYSTQYAVKFLSALGSAIGDDFRLSLTEGLSDAARFILCLQSDVGIFNYGDGDAAKQLVPEILWLSDKFGDKDAASAWLKLTEGNVSGGEDIVLSLLWLNKDTNPDEITMDTDAFFEGENVVVFRDRWASSGTTFAGIHGGKTIVNHSHLDGGSFVFDSMGIRWASDPGSSPYDLPDAFDTANGGRWKYFMNRAEAHNCLVINPDEGADHNPDSNVKIVRYETSDSGGIAVADTHELYAGKATDARRGFFCTDNRQSLVIRDEISLSGESDVYWFMQTAASVELTDSGAILTRGGKKLLLEAVADCEFEISSGRSVPLTTSPVMPNDKMPDLNRIAIKLHTSGDTSLTVKLTPYEIDGTRIIDYHKSIDEWSSDCIHK